MSGSMMTAELSCMAADGSWEYVDGDNRPDTHPLDADSVSEELFDWLASIPASAGYYSLAIYRDSEGSIGRDLEAEAFLDWDGSDRLRVDRPADDGSTADVA